MQQSQLDHYARLFVGRHSDYAIQQEDGHYRRAFHPVTRKTIYQHLAGEQTLATYVMNEEGRCGFAVFDADGDDGLAVLADIQMRLAHDGIRSYLERSRRGGHLWVLLAEQLLASQVRAWLRPYCPTGIEFYPKQDEGSGVGSLIRLPLGVHRLSGSRYPFVVAQDGMITPVADTLKEMLTWLNTMERVNPPPDVAHCTPRRDQLGGATNTKSLAKPLYFPQISHHMTIREWVEEQDSLRIIRSYVELNHDGLGCCPFGEHHSDGVDSHPSFRAYHPRNGRASSWYCYAWQQGGNVFDFLCLWYNLDASAMWTHIRAGAI